jgi:hypothetical protein
LVPFFEPCERQHYVADVFAGGVAKHLDVIEHILSGFGPRSIGSSPALEQIEGSRNEPNCGVAESCPVHAVNCVPWSEWTSTVF